MAQRILKLRCACCGAPAPAFEQWHNQDTGYGICPKCVKWIESRDATRNGKDYEGPVTDYIVRCYGEYGVHHSIDVPQEDES